ncbi:hypothetical protein, partial [Streptomyces albidoflavus]|uniref:hypothetical protein n=1 Tax=Streptomyces albidoflavus TaxID=1886 RepID=UPI001C3EB6F1
MREHAAHRKVDLLRRRRLPQHVPARRAGRYVLRKASPAQKIDLAVCSVLAHEAAMDATAAGLTK